MLKKLLPQIQYNLTVVSLDFPKEFPGPNQTKRYSHKMTLKDRHGYEYRADYVAETQTQHEFVAGHPTVFRVVKEDAFADIIFPQIGSTQDVEKVLIPEYIGPVVNTTFHLALTTAKDLMVAEMAAQMKSIEDAGGIEDRLLSMADIINDYLVMKQAERIVGEI